MRHGYRNEIHFSYIVVSRARQSRKSRDARPNTGSAVSSAQLRTRREYNASLAWLVTYASFSLHFIREAPPASHPFPGTLFAPRLFRFSSSRRLAYTPRESITCILLMMEVPRFPLSSLPPFLFRTTTGVSPGISKARRDFETIRENFASLSQLAPRPSRSQLS